MRAPSIITGCPQRCDRESSDCQTGTLEVLSLLTQLVVMRLMIDCVNWKVDACKFALTSIMQLPKKIALRRSSRFLKKIHATASADMNNHSSSTLGRPTTEAAQSVTYGFNTLVGCSITRLSRVRYRSWRDSRKVFSEGLEGHQTLSYSLVVAK